MKFKMSDRSKRKWRNRFLVVAIVALGIAAYVWYINSFTIYDFSQYARTMDLGPARPFEPMGGTTVPGMVQAAENEYLALYIDTQLTTIAVVDKRNGHIWYSSPPGTNNDSLANPWERGTMRSHVGFRFFDEGRRRQTRWLYGDSIYHDQFEIYSIPDGVRFTYMIGNLDIGIDFLPFTMEREYWEERVLAAAETSAEERFLRQFWHIDRDDERFMRMTEGVRGSRINTNNMLEFFERLDWTYEETAFHNARGGYDPEVSFDFFDLTLEFVLDGDRLIANMPISEFVTESPAQLFDVHFMKFFGAGGTDVDGFMLVPSGSGGIINFNNGGHREDPFRSAVYGMDLLTNFIRPQVTQTTRLPIFGIQNDGAAMFAHVYNGQALATVNADASGRTNSYNHAWFSFMLRSDQSINMDGIPGASGDLTIVQDESYMGDITVIYHFLAGDNPGIGEMAQVYQQFLIEQGVLTPLDGPGDRTFYMDVVGGILVREHFLGTQYTTTRALSTLDDAERFVDILNNNDIDNIQMQFHGWFNGGTNHDVAKRIRWINDIGRPQQMRDLNDRLEASGGALNPVVNFQLMYYGSMRRTRNINRSFEVALDLTGLMGFMSGGRRDLLTHRAGAGFTDWHLITHPGVLPFHIDEFLPRYENRVGINNIALHDLGNIVSESFYRRDPVNRQDSRHIVEGQMARMQEYLPHTVVFGGNDYSLQFASHLVGVPTEADMFYIIDYEVPFFPMVVHGFIEFAGESANQRENYSPIGVLLNSMTTGASPRYTLTGVPTREAQFSPHERLYSTHYVNWLGPAMEHYLIFNSVYRYLRAERIVDFEVLGGMAIDIGEGQVTVTEFSNGTRIYVNNTSRAFDANGVIIPAMWFEVREGAR